jgi:hypothetical protein
LKYKLFKYAISLFSKHKHFQKEIYCVYAQYLLSQSRNKEAALMYANADKYEESLQACINAHDFNLAFQMVSLLKYDQNQKEEISQQFIEIYSSSQSYLVRRNIEFMKIYQIFCRN